MISLLVPVSVGELLDKISILEIKHKHSPTNSFINSELTSLIQIAKEKKIYDLDFLQKLYNVNKKLWNIEDEIRIKEKNKIFDSEFIELARSVYITNDERARIKKNINQKYNSQYREVKFY